MADLNAAKTADVQEFFDRYYKPGNATLTLTGDFDPAEVKGIISEYFGDIPAGAAAAPAECAATYSTGQIRRRWPDAKATLPAVLVGFRLPEYRSEDMPALDLLAMILGQGESSRLNRAVVRERKLAVVAISVANPQGPRRGPGVMLTLAVANQGVTVDSLEAGIMAEYRRLAAEGVTAEELEKVKNGYRTQLITQRQEALFRAEALQQASLYLGDPEAVNTAWRRYLAVTVDDIKRVSDRYLRSDNSLILLITPEASR
jgi:predicted Zn-dependent peptidase